ncbi:hypothetical protein [Pedococcus sp. 2YAF34]|uniref:hypothetical protein n=1 Tax=Pedococcus sp. 2YAF34 TaxID=3233032 RepID=UPI003F97AD77
MVRGFLWGFAIGYLWERHPETARKILFILWAQASLIWTYTAFFDTEVSEGDALLQFWFAMPFWCYLAIKFFLKISRPDVPAAAPREGNDRQAAQLPQPGSPHLDWIEGWQQEQARRLQQRRRR